MDTLIFVNGRLVSLDGYEFRGQAYRFNFQVRADVEKPDRIEEVTFSKVKGLKRVDIDPNDVWHLCKECRTNHVPVANGKTCNECGDDQAYHDAFLRSW